MLPVSTGTVVGGFTLHEAIGSGGAGSVFRAVDSAGSVSAVKIAHFTKTSDPIQFARFERECAVLASIHHPNIVQLLSHGTMDDGRPWMAMAFVKGTTVRSLVGPTRTLAECWKLIRPVAKALAALHVNGMIHRDIKPENIVLTTSGTPVLVDFGLSRETVVGATPITTDGEALGTPAYMAPEQWWNQDVGPAADQYSLGCAVYELCTGKTPFVEDSWGAWAEAHLHKEPAPLQGATDKERAWISQMLAKSPSDRFASVEHCVREGDLLFAEEASRSAVGGHGVWLALTTIVLSAVVFAFVGHGGVHSPWMLCRLAGFGIWLPLALTLGSLVLAARRRLSLWLVAALVATGAFGALTGWAAVLAVVPRVPLENQLVILHEGLLEADINRAFAVFVSMGILLAYSLIEARPRWPVLTVIGAALVSTVGNLKDSLLLVLAACLWLMPYAYWLGSERRSHTALLNRGSHLVLAAVLYGVFASIHLGGAEALLWREQTSHAERVRILATLERDQVVIYGLVAVAIVIALVLYRSARMRLADSSSEQLTQRLQWFRRSLWALAAVMVCVGMNGYLSFKIERARKAIRTAYSGQFAIFAQLEPMRSSALRSGTSAARLHVAHVAASVQIARDVIAIDRAVVLRVSALQNAAGARSLSADLAHRLAAERSDGAPTVSLLVDRRTSWAVVAQVITLAREVGATHFELLFAKGSAPQWNVWAPQESVLMVPSDFDAVSVACGSEVPPGADGTVESVVQRWAAHSSSPSLNVRCE